MPPKKTTRKTQPATARGKQPFRLDERRFQALIEHSADAIAVTDAKGTILYLSPSSQQMEGYAPGEMVHRDAAEQTHPDDLERRKLVYAEVLANPGKPVHVLWRRMHRDGTWHWLEGLATNLLDQPGVNGIVTNYRDVTERKRAEEQLKDSENFLNTIINENPFPIWISDENGTLIRINQSSCKMRNVRPEDVIGKYNILKDSVIEKAGLMPLVKRVFENREIARFDIQYAGARSEGTPAPKPKDVILDITIFPIVDSSGKVTNAVVQHIDVSERKHTEEALHKAQYELELQVQLRTAALSQANTLLQTLLDHTPDQIYFKDSQSRFIKNSLAQVRGLGLSDPADVVGKTDFDFFPHAQRSHDEEQEIMRSGIPQVDFEEWIVWPDGHDSWVSTTKVPMQDQDGNIIGTFGISRDITRRKHAEEELKKARDELEAFSYSVSHDLRAPLRGIDGWSLALLEDYGGQLDEQGQNYIKRMRTETQHMGGLIDDLLELSRITRTEMRTQAVDLSAMAREIAAHLQEGEPLRQAEFLIQEGLGAEGDPHLLEVALTNLLGNAFKFTGRTPAARIEFGRTEIEGQQAFFVRDNGAGFDMAFAKKLFGAFQRMHKASDFPGTGVGLATVQRVIHRHGGRVWAESIVDQGATFYFTLEEAR